MLHTANSCSEYDLCVGRCESVFSDIEDISDGLVEDLSNINQIISKRLAQINRKINSVENYLQNHEMMHDKTKLQVLKKYAPSISQDISCVYAITVDGFIFYVGQTKRIFNRIIDHMYEVQSYPAAIICEEKRSQKYKVLLHALLNGCSMEFIILDEVDDDSNRKKLESFYIKKYNPPLNTVGTTHKCASTLVDAFAQCNNTNN